MNPFDSKRVEILTLFSNVNPISRDHFNNKVHFDNMQWNSFYETCISTNEIVGLTYHAVADEVYGVPKFMKGINRSYYDDMVGYKKDTLFTKDTVCEVDEFGMKKYWEPLDFHALRNIQLLDDPIEILKRSYTIARMVLSRSPKLLGVVCGPMSSTVKTVEENFKIFNRTVYKVGQMMDVFNQLPFEPLFGKVHKLIHEVEKFQCYLIGGSSSPIIIQHFYKRLFEDKSKFWRPYFIYNWEESVGAKIEHRIFLNQNAPMIYLPEGYENSLV